MSASGGTDPVADDPVDGAAEVLGAEIDGVTPALGLAVPPVALACALIALVFGLPELPLSCFFANCGTSITPTSKSRAQIKPI